MTSWRFWRDSQKCGWGLWSEGRRLGVGRGLSPHARACLLVCVSPGGGGLWGDIDAPGRSSFLCWFRYLTCRGKSRTRTSAPGIQSFGSSGQRFRALWWPIKSMVRPPLHLGASKSWGNPPSHVLSSFPGPSNHQWSVPPKIDPLAACHHSPSSNIHVSQPASLRHIPAEWAVSMTCLLIVPACPTSWNGDLQWPTLQNSPFFLGRQANVLPSLYSRHEDDPKKFQFCQEVLLASVLCLSCWWYQCCEGNRRLQRWSSEVGKAWHFRGSGGEKGWLQGCWWGQQCWGPWWTGRGHCEGWQ